MSIQPVNRAVKHMINSTPVLGEKAIDAYLRKNRETDRQTDRQIDRDTER